MCSNDLGPSAATRRAHENGIESLRYSSIHRSPAAAYAALLWYGGLCFRSAASLPKLPLSLSTATGSVTLLLSSACYASTALAMEATRLVPLMFLLTAKNKQTVANHFSEVRIYLHPLLLQGPGNKKMRPIVSLRLSSST